MPEGPAAAGGPEACARLTSLPLFAGLRPEDADALVASCRAVQLPAGEFLFRQGDEADDLYIVLDGRLEIRVLDEAGVSVVVGGVGAGDLVGEMGVVEAEPRSADVVAGQLSWLLCLDGPAFRGLIDVASPAAWTLLRAIRRTMARRVLDQRAVAPALGGAATGVVAELVAAEETGLAGRLRGFLDALVGGAT
jgi:CRP-like cAMP-binding protein